MNLPWSFFWQWACLPVFILGGLDEKTIAEEFVRGIADFAYAACIIGIARGILVVAEGGMIIDSILNGLLVSSAGVSRPLV